MPPLFLIAFISILALAGIGVAVRVVGEKRRRAALEEIGHGLGLTFDRDGSAVLARMGGHIPLFRRGHARRASNALSGTIEDLAVHVFDFAYTVRGNRNNTTYRQTVAAFGVPNSDLPQFMLAPERIGHRLASALFGLQDIDFEEYPEFSRRYRLSGADEAAIRARFDASLVQFLETLDRLYVEVGGGWIVVYRASRRVKPERIGAFLEEAFTICNRLS